MEPRESGRARGDAEAAASPERGHASDARALPEAPAARVRFVAVDAVKAAAIVAVVFTHAKLPTFDPRVTPADLWLGTGWVNFHVPAFLAVSGFLYHRASPIAWRAVGERMLRLLVPYTVASAVAVALGVPSFAGWTELLELFATGGTVGIYYYVFVAFALTPLVWPLSRMHPDAVLLALAALLALPIATYVLPALRIPETAYWSVRNPLSYAAFFVGGWLVRDRLPWLRASVARHPRLWLAWAALAIVLFLGISHTEGVTRGLLRHVNFRLYGLTAAAMLFGLGGRAASGTGEGPAGRRRPFVLGGGLLALFCVLAPPAWFGWRLPAFLGFQLTRTPYTAAVVFAIVWAVARAAPAWPPGALRRWTAQGVGFLSSYTYTIYLYHFFACMGLQAMDPGWPPVVRILATAAAALVSSSGVVVIGRRLLGRRAHWVLGT